MPDETKMCSKCKTRPVAFPDSTNPWCAECKSEAQKKYLESKEGQAEGKGFAEGVRLMREQLSTFFEGQQSGCFSGYEVCDLIRDARPPARD